MSVTRRRLLLTAALVPLAGCGFQPVYMPTASGQPGPAPRELAAINVPIIPDRSGQLLRQALQERFANDSGTPQHYDLLVGFSLSADAIAVRTDNLATRSRVIGAATFILTAQDPAHTRLTSGSARSVDAYNVLDQQYFAADLSVEALTKRIAEALADQITIQLAAYFRKRAHDGA